MGSYEVIKRLKLHPYYIYTLIIIEYQSILYLLSYELQSVLYSNLDDYGKHQGSTIYLRDIIHNDTNLTQKQTIVQSVGITFIIVLVLLIIFTIVIAKNDSLTRKPTYQQVQMGHRHGISFFIIDAFYKVVGHFLILLTHVLLVPALIGLAELERCEHAKSSQESIIVGNSTISSNVTADSQMSSNFVCLQSDHQWALGVGIVGAFCGVMLSAFTCLFVNSQFPCPSSLPHAAWDPKGRAYMVLWKFLYTFHYDIFDKKYHVFLRIGAFYIFYQVLLIKLEQPKLYDTVIHNLDLIYFSSIFVTHSIVILQDIGILPINSVTDSLIPILFIVVLLFYAIAYAKEGMKLKEYIARDNQDLDMFEEEADMELYINILLGKLGRLQGEDSSRSADQYASSPQIFTIISRHMENCKNNECVCKKYEPEFDRKFSSFGLSSRRFDKRQSSSMTASIVGMSDNSMLRKKIPIKISYESKCQIFKAELADCMERFLSSSQSKQGAAGVGLKLQKSFFYHAYMSSSYKALFVQLENSYTCNTFRGKIHIYHLKTRIQEEMVHSEASPLNSMDITTCLKFEGKRLIFEQRILDLCLACEAFWTELINKGVTQQQQAKKQSSFDDETSDNRLKASQYDNNRSDEDEELMDDEGKEDQRAEKVLREINDDYNVQKINDTLLEIAATVIDVKRMFNELGMINPQSVAVLQCYVLVYRYILRDEYRFEEIVRNLGQLYRTNKLEQSRDSSPMFCDSDNYSMILVSGDLKDLGRIMKVNRGVDQLLGYAPEELKGSKINKIMPQLYSQIHEEFMHSFLKRGSSNFIDKNQFVVAQNKLGFLGCVVAYIKAMVDLKLGLMFVAFLKAPQKVPMTYEPRDGGCQGAQGTLYVKTKDAHFILCDGRGNITNMSQNCMRNLGLPPTIIFRTNSGQQQPMVYDNQNISNKIGGSPKKPGGGGAKQTYENDGIFNICQFAANILNPEYEFDIAKGMNYIFDSSFLKLDKALAKEFGEIKNRMCRYNISVTLKSSEYRYRGLPASGTSRGQQTHEILLFTILINSYSFTDNPNIVIPVFREDDEQVAMSVMPILNSQNTQSNSNDELRTSKFKEFKAHVQELQLPSKISKLRKITFAFFLFLLGVFSLNYGICVSQNATFESRMSVIDILFQLTEQIPSTSRYVRTVLNIANGNERERDEVMQGQQEWEDRFQYYMRRIGENAERFRDLQEEILTQYRGELGIEGQDNNVTQVILKDLETDFTIKSISSTLSGGINLFLSKALKISKLQRADLKKIIVPFIDFQFNPERFDSSFPVTALQQDLFFLLSNGQSSLLLALHSLSRWNDSQVYAERGTFSLLSLGIAVASMLAILFIVIPLVYPLLTHYETLASLVLHALNKLSRAFVEAEVKCCNQLYEYINNKTASETAIKAAERRENEDNYEFDDIRKRRGNRRQQKMARGQEGGRYGDYQEDRENEEEEKAREVLKWSLSFEEEPPKGKKKAPAMEAEGKLGLKKYVKRGHMPPYIRRATYYEKMKDNPPERMDSFKEDESQSKGSAQSNYSQQDFHAAQVQAIKDQGLLDPDKDDNNGLLNMFELSQAKSSDIPKEPIYMRDPKEDFRQKIIVRKRKQSIEAAMKQNRCRKLVSVSLFVLCISIYLAINTTYTSLVFNYEQNLQNTMKAINERMLCYPQSLTVLKELISGSQTQGQILTSSLEAQGREIILHCYESEQDFKNLLLGISESTKNLGDLSQKFLLTSESLGRDQFCNKLKLDSKSADLSKLAKRYVDEFCPIVQNGINNLGLHEVLNYLLREQEKIVLDYAKPPRTQIKSRDLLLGSAITNQETLLDAFVSHALHWQRSYMLKEISAFAKYLFGIFDILFGVFFGALCIASSFVFFVYLNRNLRNKIVQIYHIVLLIPYGERTKRELTELIKIDL